MKKLDLGKKSTVNISVFIDTSDMEAIKVLNINDELKLDKTNLPENIIEIKSVWLKPNWTVSQLIEANSFSETVVNNRFQRFYDPNSNLNAQIKILLKSWNLHEIDTNFFLCFEKCVENPTIDVLNVDTMSRIGKLQPPEILSTMINKVILGETTEKNLTNIQKEKTT